MTITTRPNGIAPIDVGAYRIGGKGGRMAQAWQSVWDKLDKHTWHDGMQLANEAAAAHDLKPVSVREFLCRMRAAGVIEQKMIEAPTVYVRKGVEFTASRPRVHYRIASK
jgi:hypothetical protein